EEISRSQHVTTLTLSLTLVAVKKVLRSAVETSEPILTCASGTCHTGRSSSWYHAAVPFWTVPAAECKDSSSDLSVWSANLVNLAAYLEGGPAIAPVGTLTLRAGLTHVPIGPNSSYLHSTHNIGRCEPAAGMLIACAGCDKPILDKFLLNVLDRTWHADCVRCFDCQAPLTDKCFSRESKLFCRSDFFRRYGTKCGGCGQGISPSDLVRKARDKVFHLNCFTCLVCRKQLSTGEELYVLDDNKFICKEDYLSGNKASVWFQNKRSKERRLKQLTSMGRGPFFGGSRKMRGFPMNLSPGGLEDGPPGFPYFADGKFEFGYGGPMDHGGPIPMGGGEFMPGEPGQFMAQGGPGGPGGGGPDMMPGGGGGRGGGSPEFMSPGGFADNPQQLNEGLVW
ncbi:unnamed protein product, partial [Phaedon cochleariae]